MKLSTGVGDPFAQRSPNNTFTPSLNKKRLEQLRFDLRLPSLSATVDYLIDNLPKDKRKYRKDKS